MYTGSLRVLLLAQTGRLSDALCLLLSLGASVQTLTGFTKLHCDSLADWRACLDVLLSPPSPSDAPLSPAARHVCRESYAAILGYLTSELAPDAFLGLLPQNGSLQFFLPYIETAFHCFASRQLKRTVKADAHRNALADRLDGAAA